MKLSKKEHEVLSAIYDMLNRFSGMMPNNPADYKLKLKYHARMHQASREALFALSHLLFEEPDLASENIEELKRIMAKEI